MFATVVKHDMPRGVNSSLSIIARTGPIYPAKKHQNIIVSGPKFDAKNKPDEIIQFKKQHHQYETRSYIKDTIERIEEECKKNDV